ncbi:hypothetical protein MFMK1_001186 [Metallumcola ferriviriculae]|uniref:Uncharacterized protein n=1 Tax=Metallumcola ferriviriculae TaxID=3039180 RepID=A0AAU0ULA6_9FIRM|nr:hypothetical protein MFMK1_001186 [Desulfitibacteraceae bacterium MK1]
MILDQGMRVFEKLAEEIKESEPRQRDHLVNSIISFLDITTEVLEESAELREAFARVHGKFMEYPECRSTIKQAARAYQRFGAD